MIWDQIGTFCEDMKPKVRPNWKLGKRYGTKFALWSFCFFFNFHELHTCISICLLDSHITLCGFFVLIVYLKSCLYVSQHSWFLYTLSQAIQLFCICLSSLKCLFINSCLSFTVAFFLFMVFSSCPVVSIIYFFLDNIQMPFLFLVVHCILVMSSISAALYDAFLP